MTSVWQPAKVQHAPATADTLASDLRSHILPVFGHQPIGTIRRSAWVAWVAHRSAILAARTVHHIYALIEIDEYTDRAAGAAAKRVKVRLLYPATRGGLMRRDRFVDAVWKPTLKAAEKALRARSAEERAQGRDEAAAATDTAADRLAGKVDFHELRHYYASLLIHAGESVKVVQARLGHKSAVEPLDTYGHLWPDNDEGTRLAVDRALGTALGTMIETKTGPEQATS